MTAEYIGLSWWLWCMCEWELHGTVAMGRNEYMCAIISMHN